MTREPTPGIDHGVRDADEPDPIGDIAETICSVCECANARSCEDCRRAAVTIWMSSPGHREAWYGKQQRALAIAIKDVCWRATQYGQTEDGDTFAYIVTKGAMHRLIGAAQGAGISAAFRADSGEVLDDLSGATT